MEASKAHAASDEVGTCRGRVAQQEAAGNASVDWIPLSRELPEVVDAVFTATGLEDQGERVLYEGEDAADIEQPRKARFRGITTLAGEVEEPVDALVSQFQMDDAQAELADGARLLVWLEPPNGGPRFAELVALEPDGDAVFLGDCIPAWTPAFARYVTRAGEGRTAADLVTTMLVSPNGPEAVAFRASAEAGTPAGPES